MRCLCCNKEIKKENEKWHASCIKKFFGTTKLPFIDLSDFKNNINSFGEKIITNNRSITGVQKKLSLHLSKEKNIRLTIVGYPNGYILKPNTDEYKNIAIAEHLVMSMANECGIKTPLHALMEINDDYAYIIKRIDRDNDKKIHMEDFCQLANKPTEYKYNGSYERCADIIDKYSRNKILDKIELFYRLLFCFITGNSDMHLKNFSLIDNEYYTLSYAYDLLPVRLIINDPDEMALTLNGKKRNIRRNDFLKYASKINIDPKVANNMIKKLVNKREILIKMIEDSMLDLDFKDRFIDYLNEKIDVLIQ